MDELKRIMLSKYKERFQLSFIQTTGSIENRRWKIKFFTNLPRPCCKSISNAGGYAFGCWDVDGKYFIITELPALCFGLAVLRVNVFPTFFDLLRITGRFPLSKRASKCNAPAPVLCARIRAPISRNSCVYANGRMYWLRKTERLALFRVALLRYVIGYFIMQRVKTSLSILILN